ncbi:MAG: hypothetical protein KJ908_10485 [Acidobacteria bacterium]|nr:hypothetical protein [Acidobacteriota bacterium]
MTLIAALQGQDGLVIGSDSRATIGDPRGLTAIRDVHDKIIQLSDYCGLAVSGAAELANTLLEGLQAHISQQNLINTTPIVHLAHDHCRNFYTNWFGRRQWVAPGNLVDQRPSVLFILAGYDKDDSDTFSPVIYLLNSGIEFTPQKCTAGHMLAGVPQYATYLIHRLYNPQMEIKHLKALTTYLISETATQDPKVGGPIKLATITPNEGYKELDKKIIESIIETNEEQNQKLKDFFFGGNDV